MIGLKGNTIQFLAFVMLDFPICMYTDLALD
jgi:hypothetical protein